MVVTTVQGYISISIGWFEIVSGLKLTSLLEDFKIQEGYTGNIRIPGQAYILIVSVQSGQSHPPIS